MSTTFTAVTEELAAYIESLFSAEDDFLRNLRQEADRAGMPAIHISGAQGAVLQVLLRAIGATRVLEIGSLGGYSAIIMARALPQQARLSVSKSIHSIVASLNSRPGVLVLRMLLKYAAAELLRSLALSRRGRPSTLSSSMPISPTIHAIWSNATRWSVPVV